MLTEASAAGKQFCPSHLSIPCQFDPTGDIFIYYFFKDVSHITFKYVLSSSGTRVSVRAALLWWIIHEESRCPCFTSSEKRWKFYSVHVFSAKALMESCGGQAPREAFLFQLLKKVYLIFMRRIKMAVGRNVLAYGFMVVLHFYQGTECFISILWMNGHINNGSETACYWANGRELK